MRLNHAIFTKAELATITEDKVRADAEKAKAEAELVKATAEKAASDSKVSSPRCWALSFLACSASRHHSTCHSPVSI
jgi:hypothetical protein